MTVVLAVGAALLYGVSDFIGGLASRRLSVWPIGVLACTGALAGSVVIALVWPGDPSGRDFAWGALAGIGSGSGTAFLYRGLSLGRMGVVAPLSAVGAVVVPLLVGLLTGERPDLLAWSGIAIALPGIWLVSREEGTVDGSPDRSGRAGAVEGFVDGVLAGLGFGLLFAALGQVPDAAGYWPLATNQVTSVVAMVAVAVLLGGNPLPRRAAEAVGLLPGVLAALAVVLFLLASQRGLLSVAAVITALYPAFTVLLAIVLLGERVHRLQAFGLALCAASIVCVSLA